jgi:D-3-phosphoglycerate dehydrogenase
MKVQAVDFYTDAVSIPLDIPGLGSISVAITPTDCLTDALPHADYISIHVPKQKDGSAVLSKNEFELMKPGVRLANAARGGVIDEIAFQTN